MVTLQCPARFIVEADRWEIGVREVSGLQRGHRRVAGARGAWGYRIRNWACPPQLTGTPLAPCHTLRPAFSPGPQTSVFYGATHSPLRRPRPPLCEVVPGPLLPPGTLWNLSVHLPKVSHRHLKITGPKPEPLTSCQLCLRVSDLTGVPATPRQQGPGEQMTTLCLFGTKHSWGPPALLSQVSPHSLPSTQPCSPSSNPGLFSLICFHLWAPLPPERPKLTSGYTLPPSSPPAKACGPCRPAQALGLASRTLQDVASQPLPAAAHVWPWLGLRHRLYAL